MGATGRKIKLARLAKYLIAYRTIFSKNVRAQYFNTWYVDAFAEHRVQIRAGCSIENQQIFFQDVYEDADTKEYRDGSAQIARWDSRVRSIITSSSKNQRRVVSMR